MASVAMCGALAGPARPWTGGALCGRGRGRGEVGVRRAPVTGQAAAGASSGGAKFPRRKERDLYKRLGVSRNASFEEIQEARNYLVKEYGWDEAGREAIEGAYDSLMASRLKARRASGKISLKAKKEDDVDMTGGWADRVKSWFAMPEKKDLMNRVGLYVFLIGWSLVQAASSGPAFQMAVALGCSGYYLNLRRGGDKLWPSVGVSLIALVVGGLVGTIVPVYAPMLFPEDVVGPETVCAVFAMIGLFVTATFVK